jgi:hypothetical protein
LQGSDYPGTLRRESFILMRSKEHGAERHLRVRPTRGWQWWARQRLKGRDAPFVHETWRLDELCSTEGVFQSRYHSPVNQCTCAPC